MMHETQRLVARLDEEARSADASWKARLPPRKRSELEFHDEHRAHHEGVSLDQEGHENLKYYATVARSRQYVLDWIRRKAPGRVFLDYACGNGEKAIEAAKAGAELAIGIDISGVSVRNAARSARAAGVADNTYFLQADCEDTRIPADSIDLILCSGMLHHLDLSYAFPEMRRILKTGGRCLAVEALNVNPLIRLYRRLTPAMRTAWETDHILAPRDLRFARRFFNLENVRYWHLFSIAATPFRNGPGFEAVLRLANAIDDLVLQLPGLRLMAWQFTFELVKRGDE